MMVPESGGVPLLVQQASRSCQPAGALHTNNELHPVLIPGDDIPKIRAPLRDETPSFDQYAGCGIGAQSSNNETLT